jgi:hypothetical protein
MQTRFYTAFGANTASEKPGRAVPQTNTLASFRKGLTYFLIVVGMALSTIGCVKDDDDVQCGDELNPCENIVIDEIGDG